MAFSQQIDPAFQGFWTLNVEKSDFGGRPKPKMGFVNWGEHGWTFALITADSRLYADAAATDRGCALIGVFPNYSCAVDVVTLRHVRFTLKQGTTIRRIGEIELLEDGTTQTTHRITPLEGAPYVEKTIWEKPVRKSRIEASVKPAEASSAETELRAVMAERHKASVEGDTEKIASSMADDYIQTDIAGYVQDKTTWLNEYFKPLAAVIKAVKFRWDVFDERDVQIHMYGDTAVAIGTLELKNSGAHIDRQRHTWIADPDAHNSSTIRFTRVYIKRDGKWLLAALHNAVLPTTVNN